MKCETCLQENAVLYQILWIPDQTNMGGISLMPLCPECRQTTSTNPSVSTVKPFEPDLRMPHERKTPETEDRHEKGELNET